MSGLAALDAKCSSRLGIMTISYYLWTTFVAVVVGIIMVYIIHPGGAAQKEDSEESKKPMTSSADALLDLIRWELPVTVATHQQAQNKEVTALKGLHYEEKKIEILWPSLSAFYIFDMTKQEKRFFFFIHRLLSDVLQPQLLIVSLVATDKGFIPFSVTLQSDILPTGRQWTWSPSSNFSELLWEGWNFFRRTYVILIVETCTSTKELRLNKTAKITV